LVFGQLTEKENFLFQKKKVTMKSQQNIFMTEYPSNPNGSDYNAAMLSSKDGRHLVMMPHLERSTFSWNWGHYPELQDQMKSSPWIMAFENAFAWLETTLIEKLFFYFKIFPILQ